ncbi:hypothetical protein [Agrobacterium larrymoorei]|uniref:hypothetical protein n=1 Tax=Agrobacterium larrymoorei TaxID=160699 RepID=UPI0030C62825
MVTDEMVEAFGNAFWSVNAASKIDAQREHIRSALEVALSTDAEPVKNAPAVAVKADLPERFEEWWAGRDSKGEKTLDYNHRKQLAWEAFYAAALSAQVQDVADDRPMKVVKHLAEWWDTSDARNVLGGAPWCVFEAKRILSASPASKHGDEE